MSNVELIQSEFHKSFSTAPERIVRAPGRVNLIGEHTDYNDGFVLPMAIDREVLIGAAARPDRVVRMRALDFPEPLSEFALDRIEPDEAHRWSNYVRGVALALQQRGAALRGLDMVIHGNVPIGSGLSSSAALQVCAAVTFQQFNALGLDGVEIARLCQKAENEFVGVKSGIMDQFISALARAGNALLLDCRTLKYDYVPVPEGVQIVVCDTMKRRGLVDSEYNARRAECELAVRLLGQLMGRPIRALRDVSPADFARFDKELPPNVGKRARHIVTENERVLQAAQAMRRNDLRALGELMNESHTSLKNDYEVSSPELDIMVEIARQQPGCLGARLTGAGFGGCTVNLVREDSVKAFQAQVATSYSALTGLDPQVYACRPSAGAGLLEG